MRKTRHSKATERGQRFGAVSDFSYSGSICMPTHTQNCYLYASDAASLEY